MNVIVYKSYLEDFLHTLDSKERAKVIRNIQLFAEVEFNLSEQFLKQIDGKLRELRIKFRSNQHRVFYFIIEKDTVVLLNGFTKQTHKNPKTTN